MGRAMQDVSPSLISSILRCMKKPDVPLSNQKAAIQAFRLMDITAEVGLLMNQTRSGLFGFLAENVAVVTRALNIWSGTDSALPT